MTLVRLGARPRRRVLLVPSGRQAALRAVPCGRCWGVSRERRLDTVPVGTPVRDGAAGSRLAPLGWPDRAGADARAPDGAATCHVSAPVVRGIRQLDKKTCARP